MIESRYKIEYVLPDEDVKKTSPFRVLWYLLLIPLVFLVVTGITYDFSYKNISSDALELAEKAKVHIFNLGEIQKNKSTEAKRLPVLTSNTIPKESLSTSPGLSNDVSNTVVGEKTTTNETANSEPKNNKDNVNISELTSKQELQLKTIQAQVAKNSELSQNLNQLSEKLVQEQLKTEELNSQLAQQELDRKELEEQLNKALESAIDNEITLEELKSKETKAVTPINKVQITTVETPAKSSTPEIVKESVVIETALEDIPEPPPVVVKEETIVVKTETDKIIEAMENIASEKDNSSKATIKEVVITESTSEQDSITVIDDASDQPEVSEKEEGSSESVVKTTQAEAVTNNEALSDKPIQAPEPIITVKPEIEINKTEKDVESEIKTVAEVETEIVNEEDDATEEQEETVKITETETKPSGGNSAVDDIIAAMEASQTSSASKADNNIDLELEKEIKQQLVEKGDLSVDN